MEKNRRIFELLGSAISAFVMGLVVYEMNQSSVSPAERNQLLLAINILVSSCCYLGLFVLFDRFLPVYLNRARLNWLAISLFGTLLSFIALSSPAWWSHGSFDREYTIAWLSMLSVLTFGLLSVMLVVVGLGAVARLILQEVEAFKVVK